jgi:hypothetical protein
VRPVALVLAILLLGAGCGPLRQSPLGSVTAAPPPPSPELRDQHNRLDVHYHLNTPATVTSRLLAPDGTQLPIATNAMRPTAGDYVLQFDGTLAGPGPNERRVLPDGDYRVVLEVEAGGQQQKAQVPLAIRNADTRAPDVTDLALAPDRISPNFDARDDVTHITYRLAKDALVSPFLDEASPSGAGRRVWMGQEVQTAAGEQQLTWDGTANGQPVPNGNYVLGIRARDRAGNFSSWKKLR